MRISYYILHVHSYFILHTYSHKRFYQGKLLDAACVCDGKRSVDLGVLLLGPYTLVDVSEEYCRQYRQKFSKVSFIVIYIGQILGR